MIFTKSLSDKLIFFIERVDPKVVKKFIIGFYQISNREIDSRYNLDIELIDTHKLKRRIVEFLSNMQSVEHEVADSIPTEEMAFFLTHIGHIYSGLMLIEEGIPFYRESIKIREEYLKVKSLETAENYLGIGSIYEQGTAFDEALICYKKALEIRKELSYVENNLLVADSYSRLALLHYHIGQYGVALGYIEETIRIREKLLPPAHTLLESSYYNHKIIEKASQPKNDYVKLLIKPLYTGIGALISRLVGQK
jgi:tetratricopeptide (TPR) repeat protein